MYQFSGSASAYVRNLLSGLPDGEQGPKPVFAMTVRLPLELAALLFELAIAADRSRVEMARLLLQSGIDEVLFGLPQDKANDLKEAAHERYLEMIKED